MATTPTVTDGATLAVKPPRVNIFAKPDTARDQPDPGVRQPRGIFDESAACRAISGQTSPPGTREALETYQVAGAPKARRLARVVATAGLAAILAFAITMYLRGGATNTPPAMPATLEPRTPPAPTETGRQASRRARDQRRRRREQHRPHRAPRPRQARKRPVQTPQTRPLPSTPPAAPARPRRLVPTPAPPTTTRVAPAAPPEFM